MAGLRLIVGLGNPGPAYADTRHNAGVWFVDRLAARERITLAPNSRFNGRIGQFTCAGETVRVLLPDTWMNRSGEAVGPVLAFYRIDVEAMLVVHDEMAFAPGDARLKRGGGANGHNGLRDIMRVLGGRDGFGRLRVGVGHPGDTARVTPYLTEWRTPAAERDAVAQACDAALDVLDELVADRWERAMTTLHSR